MSENLPSKTPIHWTSMWQFALSLFGILALWGFALLMLFVVFGSVLTNDILGATAVMLNAAGTAFAGVLLIPSLGFALLRLLNKPIPFNLPLRFPLWIILLLPPILLLGHWAVGIEVASILILPFLHVLAAGVSVAWLLSIGLRGLSVGSSQRAWGIFNLGLVGAPLLSLIAEFVALIGFGMLYLLLNPELLDVILELSPTMSTQAPEQFLEQIESYLLQPSTLYLALLFGALVVPLLEELFKPIGVWLLVGRKPTPAQGFAAGLLSGAGFALFENFSLGASAGDDWAMIVVARIGTSLIHIVTTGLIGWALSLAWTQKRYLKLALSYFVAVALHALWNGTVILTAITELIGDDFDIPDFLAAISAGAPIIFVVLVIGCSTLLLGFNVALRRSVPKDDVVPERVFTLPEDDIIPPAQLQNVTETSPEEEQGLG
jgi:hypothetical protein